MAPPMPHLVTECLAVAVERQTVIDLTAGERWCAACGESVCGTEHCPRCDSAQLIDPATVLRSAEYRVAV